MRDNPTYPSVREVELSLLRKGWWLFPVLGALAMLAAGDPFWNWVQGNNPGAISWQHVSWLRVGLSALAFLVVPAAWRLGLQRKFNRSLVPIATVAVILAAECGLRVPLLQTPLWLAARSRLDAGQYFMGEVCYVRLEEAAGRGTRAPAVVLMGSSQLLNGVDEHLLAELVHPVPVIRRAMFGMTPIKALAMRAYVPFLPGDTCVQYLSEFDFTNQDEFPYAWFRPYASWQTLPDVLRCVSPSVKLKHWRHVVDYAAAATTEWWRMRDFLRQILFHFWRAGEAMAGEVEPTDTAAAEEEARSPLRFAGAEWKAFQAFARNLASSQVNLLVFEGDVNPSIYSTFRLQAKENMRRELAALSSVEGYRYVSKEEQGLALGAGHWRDMTHLNPDGREILTRRIAQELQACVEE